LLNKKKIKRVEQISVCIC